MNRVIAALSLLLSLHAQAFLQTGEDITDLWWNPAESGWGMNVIQQGDTSFATLFVYGANNQAKWFVAPALKYAGYVAASDEYLHEGLLYETTGPAYSAATFDPNAVTVREVGVLRFWVRLSTTTTTVHLGRVTYTVDGAQVTKQSLEKQTWRKVNHAGTYAGAFRFTTTGCTNTASNGEYFLYGATTVTQSSSDVIAIDVVKDGSTYACTYSGRYYQAGRNGVIQDGTFTCNDGMRGRFIGFDFDSGVTGMSGNMTAVYASGGCQETVRFSGAK